MRNISFFAEAPQEREVIVVGKTANVFIRQNIEQVTVEGEDPHTEYRAVEYSAQLPFHEGFQITNDLVEQIIEKDTADEAERVRAKRNALLADSDKEILPDRCEKESEEYTAWSSYRQALRDLTAQEGFPFDVVFPVKP